MASTTKTVTITADVHGYIEGMNAAAKATRELSEALEALNAAQEKYDAVRLGDSWRTWEEFRESVEKAVRANKGPATFRWR